MWNCKRNKFCDVQNKSLIHSGNLFASGCGIRSWNKEMPEIENLVCSEFSDVALAFKLFSSG